MIGRDFDLAILQAVSGMSEDQVLTSLEEADHASIIEERERAGAGLSYRFTHAFFRQTLYEEIFGGRRVRLHQQVGRALENVYARNLKDHATELAEHFGQSSDEADLSKAVLYGKLGAERAVSVFAYGEAVRLLEQAMKAQQVLDPDDALERCNLLIALGEGLLPLGEPQRVVDTVAEEAYALTETLRAGQSNPIDDRSARVCKLALEGLHRAMFTRAPTSPEWPVWTERLNSHSPPETVLRAYADISMGRLKMAEKRYEEGVQLIGQALEVSRHTDDPEMLFTAAWQTMNSMSTRQHWRDAVPIAREFLARSHRGVSARTVGQTYEFCAVSLLAEGDRDGADRALQGLFDIAERSNDAFTVVNAMSYRGIEATLDGRLEEAIDIGLRVAEVAAELGAPGLGPMATSAGGIAASYLGRAMSWPVVPAAISHLSRGYEHGN